MIFFSFRKLDGLQLTNGDIDTLVPPTLEKPLTTLVNGTGNGDGEGDVEEDEELTNALPSRLVYINGTSNHVHEDINAAVGDLHEAR